MRASFSAWRADFVEAGAPSDPAAPLLRGSLQHGPPLPPSGGSEPSPEMTALPARRSGWRPS